ncbi:MAG TPA: PKD domain-containing protein [Nitrososphaerales archaeon]|nr:PKD domain-containing protein [Nitrososphaerales archaeon]
MTETEVPEPEEEAGGWGRLVVVSVILVVVVLTLAFLLVPGLGISLGSHSSTPIQFSTGVRTSSSTALPAGTPTTGQIVRLTVQALTGGGAESIQYTGVTPVTLSMTARADGVPPLNYQWSLGDGTNSSLATVVHTFGVNRAYDIHLRVADATGAVQSKDIILNAFSSVSSAKGVVLYPPEATAGISSVGLEGGFVPAGKQIQILVDGVQVASTRANLDGYWSVGIGRYLPPKPNGSTYLITVSPLNKSKTLVTVEGMAVSPAAGVPGNSVEVVGRSYSPYTSVSVYIGGVSLGQAQTDGSGSFQANFTVPSASPLTQIGEYQVTTSPPAEGAQATYVVVKTTTIAVAGLGLFQLAVIAVVAAVIIAVAYLFVRRRRRYVPLPPPPAAEEAEPAPPAPPAPEGAERPSSAPPEDKPEESPESPSEGA